MITKMFDRGWGPEWEWKQFETDVVNRMLSEIQRDTSRTVMINSVWYSRDFHQEVMTWLRTNDWDQIVLVAMLDAAIPHPGDYQEFKRPVHALGYYPGINSLDLCSIFFHKRLDLTKYGNLGNPVLIDTAYMCLNRKPHWHRKRMYRHLESAGLLDRGLVSMGDESGIPVSKLYQDSMPDLVAPNSEIKHYGIPNNVCDLGTPENWNRCFFNVVTETFYDINKTNFVSEKIYKPILGQRPFVVYDPDGGGRWLKDRGFETYDRDFLDISDHDPADPDQLILFLKDLCSQGKKYWQHKFVDLYPKISHNFENFGSYVSRQYEIIDRGLVA